MFLEKTKTAAPYSRCGENSSGASAITVRIYGSTFQEVVDRFEAVKGEIIADPGTGKPYRDSEANGRHCRQWVEARKTLADVIQLSGFNRHQYRKKAK